MTCPYIRQALILGTGPLDYLSSQGTCISTLEAQPDHKVPTSGATQGNQHLRHTTAGAV